MNILGIGGAELILILILMLVIAGPKRMIQWAYIMGRWIAKFRVMWSQTVDMVQREFDDAGVGVKLPKTPPTRKDLVKMMEDAVAPANDPLRKTLDEVKSDVEGIGRDVNAAGVARPANPASAASGAAMGAWTNADRLAKAKNGQNGHTAPSTSATTTAVNPPAVSDFGNWSKPVSPPQGDATDDGPPSDTTRAQE
jgi:Sec-independent protein translocase protein TatA